MILKSLIKAVLIGTLILFTAGGTIEPTIFVPAKNLSPHLLAAKPLEGLVVSQDLKINEDRRADKVAALLAKYNSPMIGSAKKFVEEADEHGLDWRLLVSIAGMESCFGKYVLPNSYNPFGWGGGYMYFKSWDEIIATVSEELGTKWSKWTGLGLEQMAPTYCPPNWRNWVVGVRKFMNELDAIDPDSPQNLALKKQ